MTSRLHQKGAIIRDSKNAKLAFRCIDFSLVNELRTLKPLCFCKTPARLLFSPPKSFTSEKIMQRRPEISIFGNITQLEVVKQTTNHLPDLLANHQPARRLFILKRVVVGRTRRGTTCQVGGAAKEALIVSSTRTHIRQLPASRQKITARSLSWKNASKQVTDDHKFCAMKMLASKHKGMYTI